MSNAEITSHGGNGPLLLQQGIATFGIFMWLNVTGYGLFENKERVDFCGRQAI
jgi:hypothetical protein